jgi:hypothetical protein
MPRSINDDYIDLLAFIDRYTIKGAYDIEGLTQIIKPIHKGYYSALVLLAELHHQNAQPSSSCPSAKKKEQKELFWSFLSEAVSELGSSFFLILNGCYKASDQVLRSSIENFVKALGGLDVVGINQNKNVYEVFDRASSSVFFSTDIGKEIYQKLSELYGNLCYSVHTGTEQSMQHISALGDFPAINVVRAKNAQTNYLKIVKLYVSSLSVMFRQCFHNMHHKNRDVVELSLSANALKELHEKIIC